MKNLKHLLNLDFIDVVNNNYSIGKFDLPYATFNGRVLPDYLALYGDPGQYLKTENTFVCFYEYDSIFDGIDGIFNAIYYNNKKLLNFYKERFKGVKGFISPDYTQAADINFIENAYRCFKARVVGTYLAIEFNVPVIPNIAYCYKRSKEYCFDGIDKGSVVAISAKGCLKNKEQYQLLLETVKETVDTIWPKTIIVYSSSSNDKKIYEAFSYAINHGANIFIPENSLKERNEILSLKK